MDIFREDKASFMLILFLLIVEILLMLLTATEMIGMWTGLTFLVLLAVLIFVIYVYSDLVLKIKEVHRRKHLIG